MNNNDELMHYGVIGMRWGIRRARKNGSSYTYKSHGQKKYERKLNKLQSSKNLAQIQLKGRRTN